jgi:hypothetical protein
LRLFNRENDINYIGQGIGCPRNWCYMMDFDTFKELVNKIFTNHKNRFRASLIRISGFKPSSEYINFLSPRLLKTKIPRKIMKQ